MTELTLQTHRRTAWHFIPGLALRCSYHWGRLMGWIYSRRRRCRVQRPHLSNLVGDGPRQHRLSAHLEKL